MTFARPAMLMLLAVILCTPDGVAEGLTELLSAHVHASGEQGELRYRLFRPAIVPAGEMLPLVLFLHGAGERGSDNERQLVHGVRDFVRKDRQEEHPCFLVAPQCAKGVWWNVPAVLGLIEEIREQHPIDPQRIYVTGLSMGGYGSWGCVAAAPELFAAAIPICGGGDVETAAQLVGTPIWAFHGDADDVVVPEKSREMVAAIEAAGGQVKLTEYAGVHHNSWGRTYSDAEVHGWLFAQRRHGPVRDGDRVLFFGDSITQAGAGKGGYIRLVEASVKESHPELDVKMIGAGISGHKVPDLQARLQRDVLEKSPTVVFIYIGINDVWHWNRNRGTPREEFASGLRQLVADIDAAGARVILCTPSVIGEKTDGSNDFDPMLEEYSDITRRIAWETGSQLLDLRKLFLAHLREHNTANAPKGQLTSDSVHLNAAGNRFVADRMLEALGMTRDPAADE